MTLSGLRRSSSKGCVWSVDWVMLDSGLRKVFNIQGLALSTFRCVDFTLVPCYALNPGGPQKNLMPQVRG